MLHSGRGIGMLSNVTCTESDELVNVCKLARRSTVADYSSGLPCSAQGPPQCPQAVPAILFLRSVSDPQVGMFVCRVQVSPRELLLRRLLDRKRRQRDLCGHCDG